MRRLATVLAALALTAGVAVGTGTAAERERCALAAAAFEISGGTGDADLYVFRVHVAGELDCEGSGLDGRPFDLRAEVAAIDPAFAACEPGRAMPARTRAALTVGAGDGARQLTARGRGRYETAIATAAPELCQVEVSVVAHAPTGARLALAFRALVDRASGEVDSARSAYITGEIWTDA